ncbi:oxidoreductase family protein [Zalerion maritima]|uniref:Oxidoreductase family protein n=1 Tax=Zalerion maritima TaxID=339359 RepID=A0AAD5RLK4_9PEZI|nr:oxidoreductase family protein [Zalerion maritima]
MAPVGVALVGGGIFAKEEHLPAILASPLLSLRAIYSRSLKSAKDTASAITDSSKPDLYSSDCGEGKSYEDLLKRDDISGVILALPIMAQPEYIEAALAAGKHVLSEKPIAPHVNLARKLIQFYRTLSENKGSATWAVAENYRFMPKIQYGAEQLKGLGKIQGFSCRIFNLIQPGNKWIETSWRKKPDYQGGFLLDGGVHFIAAIRRLLGPDNSAEEVVALSSLTQPYLAPIDTVNAIVKTKSGVVGSFLQSVGTHLEPCEEYSIACENGLVTVNRKGVSVMRVMEDGKRETEMKEFEWNSGVKSEVQAWAESLSSGNPNPLQSPEEAFADLELLEKMFRSGEEHGSKQALHFQ